MNKWLIEMDLEDAKYMPIVQPNELIIDFPD